MENKILFVLKKAIRERMRVLAKELADKTIPQGDEIRAVKLGQHIAYGVILQIILREEEKACGTMSDKP